MNTEQKIRILMSQALQDQEGNGSLKDLSEGWRARVPLDPMTNSRDWGFRSMQDDPKSQSWGRQNIFDIRLKTDDVDWL